MVPLAPLITQIKDNLEQLLEVLEQERVALATATPDDILALSEEKKRLLNNIDSADKKRNLMLVKFGVADAKKPAEFDFSRWLSTQQNMDDVKALVEECNTLLDACKSINQTNAHIVSTLRKRNKSMFEMLQGHSRKNKVYTASGGTRPVSSKHTLGRA